jgi:hypothetical protein
MKNTNRSRHSIVRAQEAPTYLTPGEDSLQAGRLEYKQSLINKLFFPNLPDHYPLSKKLHIAKYNTTYGAWYISLMHFISVILCLEFYVAEQTNSYLAVQAVFAVETLLVLFLSIDSLGNCYISRQYTKTLHFFVDVITVFPTFFLLIYVVAAGRKMTYAQYEFLNILKLVRVLRIFRTLHLFKVRFQRIVFKLFLTFASLTFIASGFLHLFENVIPQWSQECQYINADTDWQPSCSEVSPASEMTYCECSDNNCELLYDVSTYMHTYRHTGIHSSSIQFVVNHVSLNCYRYWIQMGSHLSFAVNKTSLSMAVPI